MNKILMIVGVLLIFSNISVPASAQQPHQNDLVGDWKLSAIYDTFEDGHLRRTWGDKPQGLLQISTGGYLSLQVMGGDRAPKPGTVPTEPVGPVRAQYGTYTLDANAKTLTVKYLMDSFPQFIGIARPFKIEELSATALKMTAPPIRDPQGGNFTPHLEFERLR